MSVMFEPIEVGSLTLPNRFVRSATWAGMAAEDGAVTAELIDLMVALDLVGRYSDEPGSQRFPLPGLSLLYPDRGDFVGVVGDLRSGSAIRRVKRALLSSGAIPVESIRAPSALAGVRWSDHHSFRRLGMPAVMVSDTAFMRIDDYHTPDDTPDKLDYERMAGLVRALHSLLKGDAASP